MTECITIRLASAPHREQNPQARDNAADQIIAIYYFAKALEPITVPIRTIPFDFDEREKKIYEEKRQTETFRFIDWHDFSADSVTLPIDKIAASMVKELL